MLNKKLIKHSEIVRNRLRLEVDSKLCLHTFFRDKFENDQVKLKHLCTNLYKNHVSR